MVNFPNLVKLIHILIDGNILIVILFFCVMTRMCVRKTKRGFCHEEGMNSANSVNLKTTIFF